MILLYYEEVPLIHGTASNDKVLSYDHEQLVNLLLSSYQSMKKLLFFSLSRTPETIPKPIPPPFQVPAATTYYYPSYLPLFIYIDFFPPSILELPSSLKERKKKKRKEEEKEEGRKKKRKKKISSICLVATIDYFGVLF
jgi:hypothetical protein